MKIWIAGETGAVNREEGIIKILPKRLLSYYFLNSENSSMKTMKCDIKNKVELFLDSGAFSAWSQGIKIGIEDYISFIKKHKKYINVYANLDVIGDAEATLKNQHIMEKAGLSPLPCFHINEDIKYLKLYLKKYKYVALGGMVGIHKKKLDAWLNTIFGEYICDSKGVPKTKIHGFGLTSLALLLKYPWYSVDSTSWVVTSRMGGIRIPIYKRGEYLYDRIPHKILVSSVSPNLKTKDHFNNFSPERQKIIEEYLKSKGKKYIIGKSKFRREPINYELKENERWAEKKDKDKKTRRVEKIIKRGLSNDYRLRDEVNIIYFKDLEKFFPAYPRKFKTESKVKGFGL